MEDIFSPVDLQSQEAQVESQDVPKESAEPAPGATKPEPTPGATKPEPTSDVKAGPEPTPDATKIEPTSAAGPEPAPDATKPEPTSAATAGPEPKPEPIPDAAQASPDVAVEAAAASHNEKSPVMGAAPSGPLQSEVADKTGQEPGLPESSTLRDLGSHEFEAAEVEDEPPPPKKMLKQKPKAKAKRKAKSESSGMKRPGAKLADEPAMKKPAAAVVEKKTKALSSTDIGKWDVWTEVEGQQRIRECVIGDWKAWRVLSSMPETFLKAFCRTNSKQRLQVREFVWKKGNLEGEKRRLYDHVPSDVTYKSYKQAVSNGFRPPAEDAD